MFIFANMMFDEVHNSAELMDLIDRIIKHLHSICPNATESQLIRMIK